MVKRKTSKSKPEAIPTGAENGAGVIKLDPSGRITEGRFAGYYRLPHGLYSRRSPEAREQEERERRASDQAKHERFRESCVKCRQLLAKPRIREHWLAQAQVVMETENTWQGPYGGAGLCYEWPRDKAKVYAVMAICVDTFSSIRILPAELRQTRFYKANENIDVWIRDLAFDLATEYLDYIREDLKTEGLLGQNASGKKRKGSPGLPGPEAQKRLYIMKKWKNQKGGISRKDFCAEQSITMDYLETCRQYDYSVQKCAKK